MFYQCKDCTDQQEMKKSRLLSKTKCDGENSDGSVDYSNLYKEFRIGIHDIEKFNSYFKSWKWIATRDASNDPCKSNKPCSGHGYCYRIPNTRQKQCVCRRFYEGDNCEKHFDTSKKIDELMSNLRNVFAKVSGVPDVIDVFFQNRKLTINQT